MTINENLSQIKILSAQAFDSVSSTSNDILYFVEDTSAESITCYSTQGSGYIIFPSGLCIQWGQAVTSSTAGQGTTVTLPKTYSNTNYLVLGTIKSNTSINGNYQISGYANSATQAKIMYYTKSTPIYWMTMGVLQSGQY